MISRTSRVRKLFGAGSCAHSGLVVLCVAALMFAYGVLAQESPQPVRPAPVMAQAQSPNSKCQSGGVTPGPIACWPMNDPNASTVLQETIGANNASPAKSPVGAAQAPQPIAGQVGGAINFVKFPGSGLTGAVVGNISGPLVFIGQTDFSIITWTKFPPTSVAGRRHYIINKYDAPQKKGYALYIVRPSSSSSSYLEFQWGDGSNNSPQTLQSTMPITPNQWHLVAVTFARGGNSLVITLYIDGVQKGTYTSNATWGSLVNSLSIMIGYQPSSVDEPIALDELQIFNRALTANEISQVYNAGLGALPCVKPPSGMVAWYWMDGNASDFGALGGFNNPSATNAISFVPGKVGQGVTFGQGGYIDIPHSPALANQKFTIDAWVKPQGPPLGPTSNNDFWGSVIVQKGLPAPMGYTKVPLSLGWSAQHNHFVFTFGIQTIDRIASSPNFSSGNWYHVAATYDGSTMKLYVNGNLEASKPFTSSIPYDPSIPWTIGSTGPQIRAANYPRTFNGVIDELEIFNRALSPAEIQDLYKSGKCKSKKDISLTPFNPTN